MKQLYYLSYNNYYNRIAKREETIADYLAVSTLCGAVATANFFPNDGIATQVTPYLSAIQGSPDYVVVANEDGTINSRWWVIETRYNTGKTQFILSLYRDVIAEWQNEILNAPCYVEKGYTTRDDPSILLNEAIETNQIKVNQKTLNDKSNCRWIVGYLPRSHRNRSAEEPGLIVQSSRNNPYWDEEYQTLEDFPYYQQLNAWNQYEANNFDISVQWDPQTPYYPSTMGLAMYFHLNKDSISRTEPNNVQYFSTTTEKGFGYTTGNYFSITVPPTITSTGYANPDLLTKSYCENITTQEARNAYNAFAEYWGIPQLGIASYEGKYIKIGSTVYRIKKNVRNRSYTTNGRDNALYPLLETINDLFSRSIVIDGKTFTFANHDNASLVGVYVTSNVNQEYYYLESADPNFTVDMNENRGSCEDSPYDMFCFPYKDGFKVYTDNIASYEADATLSMEVATEIANDLGSSVIYDLQIVPYCPLQQLLNENGELDARGWPTSYVKHASLGIPLMGIFWCPFSSGRFIIDFEYDLPSNPYDFKVANQCDFMRLCSPTDGSMFDFSPTKNGGLSHFNVTYTYKPFQPYIHVAPEFGGLYDKTYEWDKRGLILRGDFSIAKTSSAWADFKNQNANYQDVFNRQIDNLEVTNTYQNVGNAAGMVAGVAGGAAAGAAIGSVVPGIGTAIGAVAGGLVSAIGGIGDAIATKGVQNETIDYTIDQFNMSLQAIKARPDTLTKISAFDIDCSPFPMLEYYSCSYDEKLAIKNKLKYNGITIMKIGRLVDYIDPTNELTYIKGKLIRLDKLQEDYHMINTISAEMNKGVFI